MARTNGEWAALLGGTLSRMARVHGTDAPNAYLPEDCYPVIEQTFAVALAEARAEGRAAALAQMRASRLAGGRVFFGQVLARLWPQGQERVRKSASQAGGNCL